MLMMLGLFVTTGRESPADAYDAGLSLKMSLVTGKTRPVLPLLAVVGKARLLLWRQDRPTTVVCIAGLGHSHPLAFVSTGPGSRP